MKAKRRTRVITTTADIPAGYVRLATYGTNGTGQKTAAYQAVQRAYAGGLLDAVKLYRGPRDHRGPVYVDAIQAEAVVAALAPAPAPAAESPAADQTQRELFAEATPTPTTQAAPATATPPDPALMVWAAWEITRTCLLGILSATERMAAALEGRHGHTDATEKAVAELHALVRDRLPAPPAESPTFRHFLERIRNTPSVAALGQLVDELEAAESAGDVQPLEYAELMGAVNAQHDRLEPSRTPAETMA